MNLLKVSKNIKNCAEHFLAEALENVVTNEVRSRVDTHRETHPLSNMVIHETNMQFQAAVEAEGSTTGKSPAWFRRVRDRFESCLQENGT